MARPALQSADMRNVLPNRVFALLLFFVLPAGLLRGLNTGKKEELRTAVERAMKGGLANGDSRRVGDEAGRWIVIRRAEGIDRELWTTDQDLVGALGVC
jgi:hypothetical protein